MGKPSTPRRIIQAAMFDGAIGPISATELLALPEDTWGMLRDRLTDYSHGKADGLVAKCMMCESRIFIQARKHGGKRLPLFAHYRGGNPHCPWHHGPTQKLDLARALQYQGSQESKAHRMLCELIDQLVRADPRYIRSSIAEYLPPAENEFGRYPDVYVEWEGFAPFAIEIQLSHTFQTEVSARCMHYQREGVKLIWVLYGVHPQTADLPQSFRDVIRRHRGNAFVLDREAVESSRAHCTLILKCYLKNREESYDDPKLARLDQLIFPSKGLPYFEDCITGPLRQEIDERRRPWFKLLNSIPRHWDWGVIERPEVVQALAELRRLFPNLSSEQMLKEEEEFGLLRLIAVVFSVLAAANGHTRNYATRHENVRAMLNTLLNAAPEIQRHALLIEHLLQHTNLNDFLSGTVGIHIERAKHAMEGNLCLSHEPEWDIMSYLVPEVFHRVIRDELVYLEALPAWAAPGTHNSSLKP
jgi:hypothetical protein